MKFGFYLPTRGPTAVPQALATLVGHGEELGFHSVMIADHIVMPVAFESKYPYSTTGAFPGQGDSLEQLTLMAFIAACSERLRLVTSIMVLPHRNPVLAAKMLATIDVLSKGRITVGVGVGWLREEFELLGAPEFERRGAVSDEYLEIFKKCWSEDPVEHDGSFYSFAPMHAAPKPVQKPHPPIWIGGHSRAALRRAARYGDGWHPVGANPAVPLTPEDLAPLISELKQRTEAEERDFEAMTLSFKAPLTDMAALTDGRRRPFSGAIDEIRSDIDAYAALGISELIFDIRADTLDESLARLDRFAGDFI